MKQRIDFIVGGIQKCGTTALYRLLQQHPMLIGSGPKEPHFFSRRRNSQLTEEQKEVLRRVERRFERQWRFADLYRRAGWPAGFPPLHSQQEASLREQHRSNLRDLLRTHAEPLPFCSD